MAKREFSVKKSASVSHKKAFNDTSQIVVPKELISQVVGQDESVKLIRKAAAQKRNVLLIGIPGTGKSLIAQAMSEILPVQKLKDVLIYPNGEDPNNPKVRIVQAGVGKKILDESRLESRKAEDSMRMISFILPIGWMILAGIFWQMKWYSDIIFAALLLIGAVLLVALAVGGQMKSREGVATPKLLVNNLEKKVAPFFEATGARAGALLGDVRHDPLQSSIDEDKFVMCQNGKFEEISYAKIWKKIEKKYPDLIEKHDKGYEAIILPESEQIYALGMKEGRVVPSRVYSMNRHPYKGKVIEIHSGTKKTTLTPEHKVILNGKKKEAGRISFFDRLINLVEKEENQIKA